MTCKTNTGNEDATKESEKAAEIKKNVCGRKRLANKKAGSTKKSKLLGTKQVATAKPKTKKVLVKLECMITA